MTRSSKEPSFLLVICILVGCVVATIWLVIFGVTIYLSFHGPLWIFALSLTAVVILIGLIWTTFYRLTFVQSDIRESDPRIYVTIKEPDEAMLKYTPLILRNHGGGVAHNVQVEALTICRKPVEFPPVPVIPVGESRETVPKIGGKDLELTARNDIFHWMEEDWDTSRGNITAEWSVPVTVDYDDYTGTRHIRSTMMLVFYPLQYRLRQREGWSLSVEPVCEFRNIEFSLASPRDKTQD